MSSGSHGVAIAGTGYAGMQHLQAVVAHPQAKLTGLWGRDFAKTRSLAQKYVAEAAGSFEALLEIPDTDIVIIATPNDQHAEQVIAALEANKHVLCEKPFVTTADDCARVLEAARPSGRKVLVGHVCRFSPYFRIAKDYYASGKLGEAILAEGTYLHRVPIPPKKPWWKDTSPGSMAVLGGGCHPIDLLRWVMGEIREVIAARSRSAICGQFGFADWAIADFVFENGCMGRLVVSLSAVRPYSIDITIHGTRGTLINNRLFLNGQGDETDFVTIPVTYKKEHSYFAEELDDLIQAIETDRQPLVTAEDGAKTVLTCLAIIEAIAGNTSVPVRTL